VAFQPGESLAGRYVIESVIASGGMGVIYAGRHLVLDERVAIKCLLPELSADAEQTARLLGEARAAAKIRSEHVARIIDADRLPDGTVFLAMEHLDGRDLETLLAERGPLPVDEAITYILQASEALAEAHACGIIHRDLKPANLFAARRADGSTCIKVLDFGISKVLSHEAQVRTRTGTFMGTPMYASPEQLTTPGDVDRRTDVWALGCVLYELLAGVPPFVRDTMGALVAAIIGAPLASITARRADVSPAVDAAVARCLEKDRARRWNDIAELAAALAPFAPAQAAVSLPRIQALARPSGGMAFAAPQSGHSLVPPVSSPHGSANVSAHARTVAAWNGPTGSGSAPRSSSTPWIVASVALVALTTGGIMLKRSHRGPAVEPPVATETAPTPSPVAAPVIVAAPVAALEAADAAANAVASAPPATGTSPPPTSRPGVRRPPATTSPAGKTDAWDMPIKK
jgi:serine/threonine-protein kinase